MPKYLSRNCNYCNKIYLHKESQLKRTKYCSKSCSAKALKGRKRNPKGENKTLICLCCNKSFERTASRAVYAKYCSKSCTSKGTSQKSQIICHICSSPFEVINHRKNTAKYCSNKCRLIQRRTGFKEERKCIYCKATFSVPKSRKKKYCSLQCFHKEKIDKGQVSFSAARASLKKSGLIKKCERCGYGDHTHILGIHHKDRDRKNNDRSNLEILCPNCHSLEHNHHICHGYSHNYEKIKNK